MSSIKSSDNALFFCLKGNFKSDVFAQYIFLSVSLYLYVLDASFKMTSNGILFFLSDSLCLLQMGTFCLLSFTLITYIFGLLTTILFWTFCLAQLSYSYLFFLFTFLFFCSLNFLLHDIILVSLIFIFVLYVYLIIYD